MHHFEKRQESNLETDVAFIDFRKAFDRVDWRKLWENNGLHGVSSPSY